jgi:hypothetical protein
VNEANDAAALAEALRPALGNVIAPMAKFVGLVVARSGVSVQGNSVSVDTQQTVLTVADYAKVRALLVALAPVLTHLLASQQLLEQGFRYGQRGIIRYPFGYSNSYEYVRRCCLLGWPCFWLYYFRPQSRPQQPHFLGQQIGNLCYSQPRPLG